MPDAQGWSRWKFVFHPRWLAWHLFMVVSVAGMCWLGDWQWHRAESGNALSWGYTFEWPFFAATAFVFWVKTLRDEVRLPLRAGAAEADGSPAVAGAGAASLSGLPGRTVPAEAPDEPEDEELAAYNAYLSRLHAEASGHGRWHGLR